MRALMVVFLVVLAGCADKPAPDAADVVAKSEPTSMLENWDTGMAAGEAWNSAATLVGVAGWELATKGEARAWAKAGEAKAARAVADETLGDGQGQVWRFTFVASGAVQDFYVSENEVVLEIAGASSMAGAPELTKPSKDAKAVLDAAKDFLEPPADPRSIAYEYMGSECGPHALVSFYANVTGMAINGAYVHAETGEVAGPNSIVLCEEPAREFGTASYQVRVNEGDSATIPIAEEHTNITFVLTTQNFGGLPAHTVKADIRSPDGTTEAITTTSGFGQPAGRVTMEPAMPGDWEVTFTLTQGAAISGSLLYCTSGKETASSNGACED